LPHGRFSVAFPESIAKAREHWRPSARALELADGVWGHRKRAARAEHARALDGPPGEFWGGRPSARALTPADGVWGHRSSAGRAEHVLESRDHSHIVIDEVAGMVVAGLFLPGTWLAVGVAFVLFRIFDIVKPFPANLIDGRVEGGLGVVGDDLVAGVYAGILTRLLWLL